METIQQLILDYKVREAFWAAAENVERDKEHQRYFVQLLRQRNNVALLIQDAQKIHQLANDGNPYMEYAVARFHDCLPMGQDDNRMKLQGYTSAFLSAGIADARAFMALAYRDGDFGEADVDLYCKLIKTAAGMGSEKAIQQELRDAIYGQFGKERAPEQALATLENIVNTAIRKHEEPDPGYYSLMGEANIQLERVSDAIYNYETAARKGCSSAFFWQAFYGCCDDYGYVDDRDGFMQIMEKAQEVATPQAYLEYPMLMDEDFYDEQSEEDKAAIRKCLSDDLEYAALMGEPLATMYLADYYEKGIYGFPQNNAEAWKWYTKGALMHESSCLKNMAHMILDDHTAPEGYDDAFAYECAYKALMLRGDTLQTVIEGYRKGMLTNHAAAIEQIYLPRFDREMKETLEQMKEIVDEPDDDGRYDAFA